MLIDTHAHLNFSDYQGETITALIERSRAQGVELLINIGTAVDTSEHSVRLAHEHKPIYAAVGIHPHDATKADEAALSRLYNLAANNLKVVAIGEIGLDYYREDNDERKAEQRRVFREQLQIAKELNLPFIVHSREALVDVLAILKEAHMSQGVMHCFGEDAEGAQLVLAHGLYLSFTGIVTFKNAHNVCSAVNTVPLERLMLETDCPFLAPEPYRGQRNEPAYLPAVARKIAEIKKLSYLKVSDVTTKNAFSLFPRLASSTAP